MFALVRSSVRVCVCACVQCLIPQNVDSRVRAIKVEKPRSSKFVLNAQASHLATTVRLAPGLEASVDVTHTCVDEQEVHDRIVVRAEGERVEVPIHTSRPRCEMEVTGSLDYGIVVIDTDTSRSLRLHNTGKREGQWESIVPTGVPVKLLPPSGSLAPGASEEVQVVLKSQELGSFGGRIEIAAAKETSFPSQAFEVTSTVVSQGFELYNVGTSTALHKINFGKVHYGAVREVLAEMYNAGPVELPFSIRLVHETGNGNQQEDGDDCNGVTGSGADKGAKAPFLVMAMKKRLDNWKSMSRDHTVTVEPSSGCIRPYGRARLKFIFRPQKDVKEKGFSSTTTPLSDESEFYSFVGLFSAKGLSQRMKIPLQGRGVRSRVRISPNIIDFGDVHVKNHADVVLTLKNESDDLPVLFQFPHSHALHVSEAMGRIHPASSTQVLASYVPKTLGRFKDTLVVDLLTYEKLADDDDAALAEAAAVNHAVQGEHMADRQFASMMNTNKKKNKKLTKRRLKKVGEALLHVTGFSSAMSTEVRGKLGGIDKLDKDFVPERRFVVPIENASLGMPFTTVDGPAAAGAYANNSSLTAASNLSLSATRKWVRPKLWETEHAMSTLTKTTGGHGSFSSRSATLLTTQEGNQMALSIVQHQQRQQHREHYARFIKEERERRCTRTNDKRRAEIDDPLNLGLRLRSGLTEPSIALPTEVFPLMMLPSEKTLGSRESSLIRPRNRPAFDKEEEEFGVPTFGAKPANAAQRASIAMPLSPDEIPKVSAGPKVVNFGCVSAYSSSKRVFGVTNDLSRHILVCVHTEEHDELKDSLQMTQLVPPGATAGFPITLRVAAMQMAPVMRTVRYSINNASVFSFSVAAEVVPVTLDISTASLQFAFDVSNPEQYVDETLTIRNPGAQPAEYTWEPSQGATTTAVVAGGGGAKGKSMDAHGHAGAGYGFTVTPRHGVVSGKSSQEVRFRWRPHPNAHLHHHASAGGGGGAGGGAGASTSAAGKAMDDKSNVGAGKAQDEKVGAGGGPKEDGEALTSNEAVFTLRVVGGSGDDRTVHCRGEPPEGKCAFRDRLVDFKSVSLGVRQRCTVALRNVGNKDTIFNVEDSLINEMIEVTPRRGEIATGTTQTLTLSLDPRTVGALETKLVVNIRGGKQLSLPVRARIIVPDICLKEERYSFESVYMGGMARRTCTVVNKSDIQVTLDVDFSAHQCFGLDISRDQWSTDDYDEVPLTCVGKASMAIGNASAAGNVAPKAATHTKADAGVSSGAHATDAARASANEGKPMTTAATGSTESAKENANDTDRPSNRYKVVVAPRKELSFYVVFKPDAVTDYDFEMPVSVVGLPEAAKNSAGLSRQIVARALRPRMLINNPTVSFGSKIVLRERVKKIPYSTELTMKNNDDSPFVWRLGAITYEDDLGVATATDAKAHVVATSSNAASLTGGDGGSGGRNKGAPGMASAGGAPASSEGVDGGAEKEANGGQGSMRGSFDVEPMSGKLEPGEEVAVKVTFLPRDSIAYRASVPVYLDGKTEYDYMIELVGAGSHPKIVCLEREVMLPPVPLGVTSVTSFWLLNQGYDNLDLQYKLPADSSNIPLELAFPEGQMIGIAKDRLRVEVRFCSPKAMSFTAAVVFLDEDGKRFPVQVSGVADNSLLTTYPFVYTNRERISDALAGRALAANQPVRIDTESCSSYSMPHHPFHFSRGAVSSDEPHAALVGGGSTGIGGASSCFSAVDAAINAATSSASSGNNAVGTSSSSSSATAMMPRECVNIVRFFNASTMFGPFSDIVEAIVSSRGAVFIELLEFYSGKSVPGKMSKFSAQKKEQTDQLLAQYEKILIFMKGHGALLNSLKPEYLVDADDMRRIVSHKQQRATDDFELQQVEPWRRLEEHFPRVSRWAWGIMLQQLVKTTILCRITPRQFAELPVPMSNMGVVPSGKEKSHHLYRDASLSGSNVYSVHESILLKWMTNHLAKVFPRFAYRVTNFDEHLCNGLVIFSLLVAHWPGLKTLYSALRKPQMVSEPMMDSIGESAGASGSAGGKGAPSGSSSKAGKQKAQSIIAGKLHQSASEKHHSLRHGIIEIDDRHGLHSSHASKKHGGISPADARVNASIILRAMRQLELPFPLTEEQLVSPDAREMLIFCIYLYQTLPQLTPITTVLFSGKLGATIRKEVELSNPTAGTVAYNARLEGSSEFSVPFKSLMLEPRSSVRIPIECEPRTSRTSEGFLIMQSSREGSVYAATNVFRLCCEVAQEMPLVDVGVSGSVYEMVTKDIEVKNPYPGECDFAVTVVQGDALRQEMDAQHQSLAVAQGSAGNAMLAGNAAAAAIGGSSAAATGALAATGGKRRSGNAAAAAGQSGKKGSDAEGFRYPDAFGCDRRTMSVRKGDASRITIFFLPFTLGTHRCLVRFSSAEFGHFVYSVTGEATLPSPMAQHRFSIEPHGVTSKEIHVPIQNSALESAKRLFLDRHPLSRNQEQSELARASMPTVPLRYKVEKVSAYVHVPADIVLHAGSSNAKSSVMKTARQSAGANAAASSSASHRHHAGSAGDEEAPKASANANTSLSALAEAGMADRDSGMPMPGAAAAGEGITTIGHAAGEVAGEGNVLPLSIEPKGAGVYPCRIVLSSASDVRVLDVEFSAASTAHTAELDFVCTAFQEIVQDIPLINSSEKALAVRATIVGDRGCFSGARELSVDPFTTTNYSLHFRPTMVGAYEGELQLHIVTTGESTTYRLKGVADDPVAEGHIKVSMRAREHKTTTVLVPNVTAAAAGSFAGDGGACSEKANGNAGGDAANNGNGNGGDRGFTGASDVTYAVYSDLSFVYGEAQLKVRKNEAPVRFEVGLCPPKSGVYRGSVTFAAPSGQYVWYTLEVDVEAPSSLDVIDVRSEVRQAKVIDVELTNPLEFPVTLEVRAEGRGLNGSDTITLGANTTGSYELLFCPLVAGESEGSLVFTNEMLGEFQYKLHLSAEPAAAIDLPEMTCELGDEVVRAIELTNPTRTSLSFTATSSNPVFSIHPETFELEAFATGELELRYAPRALNEPETGEIRISLSSVDEEVAWLYNVSGAGMPPSRVESVLISAPVGDTGNGMITFRNPFPQQIAVNFHLTGQQTGPGSAPSAQDVGAASDSDASSFGVLIKPREQGYTVEALGILQIPVFYSPRSMDERTAELIVSTNSLSWKYKILGQAETIVGEPLLMQTRSRKQEVKILDVQLHGCGGDVGMAPVSVEDVRVDLEGEQASRNALSATPVRVTRDAAGVTVLSVRVSFSPLRVMSTTADLIVCGRAGTKHAGGRWRQEIRLLATESETEGVVDVPAQVGTVGHSRVAVHSDKDHAVPFKAYFSPESAIELDVSPISGMLPAADDGPLGLSITYSPVEYGRAATGVLIVETEEMQWSFQINGVRPEYTPPRGVSRLDMSPSEDVMRRLVHPPKSRTNFVKENMSKLRATPSSSQRTTSR